ncbi:MAG: hypothetical protein AAFQ63_15715 [Cyanobacteria bacterium J06621_11]
MMIARTSRKSVEQHSVIGFKYLKPIQKEKATKPRRWIDSLLGCLYGGAVFAAAGFSAAQTTHTEVPPVPSTPPAEQTLWETVGSPTFKAWQESYQTERRAELLEAAKADREMARDYKVVASQGLAASLLPHASGETVISTTAVSVQCFNEGDLGWAAALTQLDDASPFEKQGTIGHLAECYPGIHKANNAVGKAGKYQPSVRD